MMGMLYEMECERKAREAMGQQEGKMMDATSRAQFRSQGKRIVGRRQKPNRKAGCREIVALIGLSRA